MPKIKSVLSQLCAALPYCCLKFGFGTAVGFGIIIVAELSKENSEIPMSRDELSWFASVTLLSPLAAIITGFSMNQWGSRAAALGTALIYIISWLLFYYSTDAITIIISEVFNFMTATSTICGPYISEITEPQLRGPLLAIAFLISAFGSFFSLLLGSFMYWRHVALVNLAFPLSAGILVLIVPNSPTWLANKGRLNEAEKALCWLRGWVKPIDINNEFHALVDSIKQSKLTNGNIEGASQYQRFIYFFQQFRQRSIYLPLGTLSLVFFLYYLSGGQAIQTYSGLIFRQMNSPIDESISSTSIGVVGIIGQSIILIFVRRFGKRGLAFFSFIVAGFAYLIIAIIGFLELKDDYLWISPIAMIIAIFANASAGTTIPYMLSSEIFPSSFRYIGSSLCLSISLILFSIMNKLFLYTVDLMTLYGVFLMFALVNVLSFVVYYAFVPETEGRLLKEIEDHYKGVKRLNRHRK